VAASSLDKLIFLWDLTTGIILKRLFAYTDQIYYIQFTPDYQFLISGSVGKTVLSWNVGPFGTDQPLTRLEGHNVSRKIIVTLFPNKTD
jgi:glucose repression regulatory protein TUP1